MSRVLFAAKHLSQTQLDDIAHEQTIICNFQVTWWALGQVERKKFALNDNVIFFFSGVVQLKTF